MAKVPKVGKRTVHLEHSGRGGRCGSVLEREKFRECRKCPGASALFLRGDSQRIRRSSAYVVDWSIGGRPVRAFGRPSRHALVITRTFRGGATSAHGGQSHSGQHCATGENRSGDFLITSIKAPIARASPIKPHSKKRRLRPGLFNDASGFPPRFAARHLIKKSRGTSGNSQIVWAVSRAGMEN